MYNYNTKTEMWVDVDGYEGIYQISNKGNVRSLDRYVVTKNGRRNFYHGKILKQSSDKDNYLSIELWRNGQAKRVRVHRLVTKTFIGSPSKEQAQVNHKNGKPYDNRVENLEWCTPSENMQHAYDSGLIINNVVPDNTGANNGRAKLTETDVIEIINLYKTGDYKQAELAEMFGIVQTGISGIVLRKTWKHIELK